MEVLGGTEREIAPVRAAVEAHRRVLNVTEPSNTALKRELESKWVTGIGLLAANPAMQGLRCAADFRRNGLNGRPLGGVVVQVFQNHAHSTFTDFGGVGRSLSHSLIFSRVEASTKPGAIQGSYFFKGARAPANPKRLDLVRKDFVG